MELISVIVPVYKVESYLDRCVQSVADQTYRNLEIILVDDGSPDSCGRLCDAWAEKDSRIRVIHKANGGPSDARNAGMAAAKGKYIGFVDSDDRIAPEMYQRLYERMTADGCDLGVCGVVMVPEDGAPSGMLTKMGSRVMNTLEAMEALVDESWLKQPVWNRLYKAELIRDLLFPVGKCHEDVFWSYRAVARAEKVSVLDAPCYFYTQRRGSIMGAEYSLKRLDAMEARWQRLEFIENQFPELTQKARVELLFACLYHGQQAIRFLDGDRKRRALAVLKPVFGKVVPETGELSLSRRFWLRLGKCSFTLCCRIRNLLKIGC